MATPSVCAKLRWCLPTGSSLLSSPFISTATAASFLGLEVSLGASASVPRDFEDRPRLTELSAGTGGGHSHALLHRRAQQPLTNVCSSSLS